MLYSQHTVCKTTKPTQQGKEHTTYIIIYLFIVTLLLLENIPGVETELFDDLSVVCAYVGITYAFAVFLSKQKNIVDLIRNLGTFEEHEKPPLIETTNKTYNLYTKIYLFYCCAAPALCYFICYSFEEPGCKKKNLEYGRDEVCGMLVPIWLPFEFNYTPVKQLVLMLQCLSASVILGSGTTINLLTFFCMQHLCKRIRHLKHNLQKVFVTPEGQRERLYRCIHQNIRIIQ